MKGRYVIKKSRKFIVSLIIAVFLVGIFPTNISTVTAMEKEISLDADCNIYSESPYNLLENIVDLKSGGVLNVNGTSNPLFWEFDNMSTAFDIIISKFDDELNEISSVGNLDTLSLNNWKEYFNVFKEMYFDNIASGDIEDINILNQFFTVCENHEINSQARILCNQENVDIFELINYLPYTSPIIDTINQLPMTRAASFNFNKSTAVSYAKKYAVNPNPSYTTYSTDCTNFASQILRSGGAPTNTTWKPYTASWSAAHNFETYWYSRSNSQYASGNFNTFSGNLQAGDFIIADWEKDRRYNHVAFVVASGSKTSSGYYDVTIAQHTSNYCAKVSSSVNGWENTSGTYVRIRF